MKSILTVVGLMIGLSTIGAAQAAVNLGVLNSRAKTLVQAQYPPELKTGAGGDVYVLIEVNDKGVVTSAEAISGDRDLRKAAVAAARKSVFSLYLVKGKPTAFSGVLRSSFPYPVAANFGDLLDKKNLMGDMNVKNITKTPTLDDRIYKLTSKLRTDPKDFTVFDERAYLYYKKGDAASALTDIVAALAVNSEDVTALKLRGIILRERGQSADANKDFDAGIAITSWRIDSRRPEARDHVLRADLLRLKGDFTAAIAGYRAAAAYNMMDPNPTDQIEILLEEQKGGYLTIESDKKLMQLVEAVDDALEKYEATDAAWKSGMAGKKEKTEAEETSICQSYNEAGLILEKIDATLAQMEKEKLGVYQKGVRQLQEIKAYRRTTLAPPFCIVM